MLASMVRAMKLPYGRPLTLAICKLELSQKIDIKFFTID
jgi:hypothetical protein